MRICRIASIVIAAAFVWGCAADPAILKIGSAPRTTSLKASDPDGGLIIGIPNIRAFLGFRKRHRVRTLEFHSYDPATNRLVSPKKGGRIYKLSHGERVFGIERGIADSVEGFTYILQKMPAGHYYLVRVHWGSHAAPRMRNGSIAVEVVPGKITYFGNLHFRLPVTIFGRAILNLDLRRGDVAKEILKKYPQITAEFQNKTLRIFELSCDLGDGIKACYGP